MFGIGADAFEVMVRESILKLPPKFSSKTSNLIIGMTALERWEKNIKYVYLQHPFVLNLLALCLATA